MIYFGNVRRLLQFYSFFYYIIKLFHYILSKTPCSTKHAIILSVSSNCKIMHFLQDSWTNCSRPDQNIQNFARSDQNYQDLAGEFSTRVEKKNLLQVRRLETSLKFFSFQPPMFLVAALLNRTTP